MGPKIQNWANSLPSGWLSLDQLSMYYESADLQKMALHIRACLRFELKAVWAAPSGLKKDGFLVFFFVKLTYSDLFHPVLQIFSVIIHMFHWHRTLTTKRVSLCPTLYGHYWFLVPPQPATPLGMFPEK